MQAKAPAAPGEGSNPSKDEGLVEGNAKAGEAAKEVKGLPSLGRPKNKKTADKASSEA